MSFGKLRQAILPHLFLRIMSHPFNKELAAGTLPKATFRFFLEQDALYLADFSKALKLIAYRLTTSRHAASFHKFADDAFDTQNNLHAKYLGNNPSLTLFPASTKKIPIIEQYTAHLLQKAQYAPITEAIACMLPCYWIYLQLGLKMAAALYADSLNPYREWIASYSNPHFAAAVKLIVQIYEEFLKENPCPIQQSNNVAGFVKSSEFEMYFWNYVYKKMARENALPPTQPVKLCR